MKALRFGSAVSALALAGMLAACAAPTSRTGSAMKASSNLALALRAQMALGAGDFASAVDLAERAVENRADDATLRALLGNAYFAGGRFASAESAYRDSLTLAPNQPALVLKLALVEIAQGKNHEALGLLESARGMIDPADHGLALALAGQPGEAVQLLDTAARAIGADARVRQNLALAYALSGDWETARTVAEQDLAPNLVDARIQQWMTFAKPVRASDQVAALTGIAPAASDPGQPVRLALNGDAARYAQAAPAPAPQPVAAPAPQVAVAAPAFAAPQLAPVQVAAAEPAPAAEPEPAPAPMTFAAAAMMAPEAPAAFAAMAPREVVAAPHKPTVSKRKAASARKAAMPLARGKSNAVVQLGAYGSPQRVTLAWEQLTRRYPALRNYSPMRARFDGPRGTVWRLSIKGFASQSEAIARCSQLRGRGGSCFVRRVAGDAPVQLASR